MKILWKHEDTRKSSTVLSLKNVLPVSIIGRAQYNQHTVNDHCLIKNNLV